jgi:hypothetical protein
VRLFLPRAQARARFGSKVILWTNFIANADWLARQFKDSGSVVVHGNRTIAHRNAALDPTVVFPRLRARLNVRLQR